MEYSKETLTPICRELFTQVQQSLPHEIAERLTCSRCVKNHGSYRTVLLFNVWDVHQPDIFSRDHFCYCLAHDPMKLISGGTTWYFHLWINTIRLYRDRLAIKAQLERDLAKCCPPRFKFEIFDRAVSAKIGFNFTKPPEQLLEFLLPHYIELISAIHPVIMPILNRFTTPVASSERAEVVAARGRVSFKPVRTNRPDIVREYSRSIPSSWKPRILEKHGHRCAHCGADLRKVEYHFDHIKPFSREGATTEDNLQPLCVPCNLKKGNRQI